MSDTPRTDAALKWAYDDLGNKYANIDVLAACCMELERENAALHAAIAAMPTCRCGMSTEDQCNLSVENAALLEDKEALDWLDQNVETVFFKFEPDKFRLNIRETFKRARAKEAKPNA